MLTISLTTQLLIGVAEQVVVGDLEPHPRVVLAAVAQAHAASGTRRGEHLHPVVDRQRVVVGVDELDRAVTLHLLGAPAQDLRDRLVDLDDEAAFVLFDRRESAAPSWELAEPPRAPGHRSSRRARIPRGSRRGARAGQTRRTRPRSADRSAGAGSTWRLPRRALGPRSRTLSRDPRGRPDPDPSGRRGSDCAGGGWTPASARTGPPAAAPRPAPADIAPAAQRRPHPESRRPDAPRARSRGSRQATSQRRAAVARSSRWARGSAT